MTNHRLVADQFETPGAVAEAARDHVLEIVTARAPVAPVHVVLAGGSTPAALYRLLAQEPAIDWTAVHVWFGDERTVPPDHQDSNFKMARDTLLSEIDIPAGNVHRMRGEDAPDRAAAAYAEEIRRYVPTNEEGWPVFDVVILGLGDDGHTASLFPGTTALDETQAIVVSNVVPQQNTVRITLTPPVLDAAAHVLFLVTGAAKAEALARVFSGAPDAPPAAGVRPQPGELRWLVDAPAAGKLTPDQVAR